MDASQTSLSSGTKKITPDISLPSGSSRRSETARGREDRESDRSLAEDLWTLTKPEISFLVTLSALAGFLLASTENVDVYALFHTLMGTALTAGGSGVLNHYRERNIDKTMRRTRNRPLPAGRISSPAALVFGGGLATAGIGQLLVFINGLTAVLALTTVLLYLTVYTPLKRITTYNTLIGCFPGALPALGGWAAATGSLDLGGWLIFGILFAWQMPHFLALAWMYRKDYARGGFAMLPVIDQEGESTARQTFSFTLLLILLSILPTVFDLAGWIYLIGILLVGIYFLLPAIDFLESRSNRDAKRVLKASIMYVPALVGLLVLDRIIF